MGLDGRGLQGKLTADGSVEWPSTQRWALAVDLDGGLMTDGSVVRWSGLGGGRRFGRSE